MKSKPSAMTCAVFGYIIFSVIAAWAAWYGLTPIGGDWIYKFPVIKTLSHGGGSEITIAGYFMLMICLLPFIILIEAWLYPVERIDIRTWTRLRAYMVLLTLLLFECLLAWFMFFIEDRNYVGTRIRVFIYLSSTTPTGLGLIYGLIYSMFATIVSMVLVTVFKILPRVTKEFHG